MATYVTVDDVDTILGVGWAGTGDPDRAVMEANAWLTAYGVPLHEPVEPDIKQAGALLTKEAAQGALYADSAGDIKRKSVKAGSVETETEYADGSRATTGVIKLVKSLLRPFTSPFGASVTLLKRL